MIRDALKWSIATARIVGFMTHLPHYPHEKRVHEYHSIIKDFEQCCDDDFSAFKVPDSELELDQYRPPELFSVVEPAIPGYRYCESSMFRAKVSGLTNYITLIMSRIPGARKPPKAKEELPAPPTPPSVFIGQMHGSQFVQGSTGVSIKNTFNPKSAEFRELVQEIKSAIPQLTLEPQQADQLRADVGTIEMQVESPAPKYSIISESANSIRSILEGIAANVITTGLLVALNSYFPK